MPNLPESGYPLSSYPSERRRFYDDLHANEIDIWGLVVYRCTYANDSHWSTFTSLLESRMRDSLTKGSTAVPELLDTHKWTFFSDRENSDGATTGQCREHFKLWAAEAVERENPRALTFGEWNAAAWMNRYTLFVHIDEKSLHSIIEDMRPKDESLGSKPAVVNVVNAMWTPHWRKGDVVDGEEWMEEDGGVVEEFETVEGYKDEDVGFIVLWASQLGFQIHDRLDCQDMWYLQYRRPPEDVVYL